MNLNILCTPSFSSKELQQLESIATSMHISVEEVVRKAVRFFADKCVPTHFEEKVADRV